jgi:ERCC4-type nuclease
MTKKKIPNYTVIKDTREQNGWFFSPYDKCDGMEIGTLHTGDYTLKGYEEVVCVERKASVSEIAMNLGRKKKPFQEEMERMKQFPFSFLILEFSMDDLLKYPEGSRVPVNSRSKVKVTGKYLLKCLIEFQIWYDTKILFCDNKQDAFLVTNSIFKRLMELFNEGSDDADTIGRFEF